jgi:3-oxoacyl-[acyl-carrier protein] reductase
MPRERPLKGRVALVTGAAQRTGRTIALMLARAGADVAIHYQSSADEAATTLDAVRALGSRGVTVAADLRDAQSASDAYAQAQHSLGPPEILVNNVGRITWKPLGDLSTDEWQDGFDATVTATWNMCRAALPGMRARQYGRIINILDVEADRLDAAPFATAYKLGKTAAWRLTLTLAQIEAPYGITVNAVSPGVLDHSIRKPPTDRIPAGRYGTSEEIARCVCFLADEQSGYITGSNLKVSGGYLI